MSFGYAFFIVNDDGSFKQEIVRDKEDLEPDEMDDGDKIIAKIPLTEKSLQALEALDAFEKIERIIGSDQSLNSFCGLMEWLVKRSSQASFALGRKLGREEQSELHSAIDNLTNENF